MVCFRGDKLKCPFVIKVCTKCKRILVANNINFGKEKYGKYGLRSKCRKCRNECKKKYREDNKDKIKEYQEQWRENNKDKIKDYYKDNQDKIKEKSRQWNKNNPEKVFNRCQKRRQLEENQGNGITKEQWKEMMEFFEWRCAYSGEYIGSDSDKRTIDHIVPLSEGGENEIWNLVPMYANYNYSKSASNMEDWYIEQDFFNIDRLLKIYEWIEYSRNKWGVR